jgi:hypothetical protein
VPSKETFAVLGFRPHTGWTAAVALAGKPNEPKVIDRRRIAFGPEGEGRFVYHRAEEGPRDAAHRAIAGARKSSETAAAREIAKWIAELKARGFRAMAAAVPTSRRPLPKNLDEILGAHSRIHAAEGAFYRDAIASACETSGLEVRRVVERELPSLASALLKTGQGGVETRLRDMGKILGPPWSEDQKLATLAAWLQLGARNSRVKT